MLGKLIKYEFKATKRFMLLLYGLLMIISVLMSVMLRFNTNISGNFNIETNWNSFTFGGGTVLEILAVLLVFSYGVLCAAALSAMYFYAINRFRRNLLGNEGYLMHTLPVRERDNLLAKSIVSVIWTLSGIAAVVISGIIIGIGAAGTELFSELHRLFQNVDGVFLFKSFRFVLTCAELLILLIVTLMNGYFHIYASMAVGYSLNRHRAAASVGIFVALSIVQSILQNAAARIFISKIENHYGNGDLYMIAETIFIAAFGLGFYFIAKYFMSRRLNLQ